MREAEFKAWLDAQGYSPGTINTQMSKVRKLDRVFGDLDMLHVNGELDSVEARLSNGTDLPDRLGNEGERKHLPTSLRYYRRFLGGDGRALNRNPEGSGMNEAGFRAWLEANYSTNTVATKLSEARQLAKAYGNLDTLYDEDHLEALMQSLRYTAADKAQNRPNPSKVKLTSDLYRDLSNLRTTVNYYKRYRGESQPKPDREAVNKAIDECAALGVRTFLETYGFGASIDYWVVRDGARYPSKAVFGVAHQFMPGGTPLDGKACDGTVARRHLDRLGFEIVESKMPDEQGMIGMQAASDGSSAGPGPTNLILYGPPGTGKTWRTAEEAVRLCDGAAPADRTALRQRYDQLVEAGQVRLVTFHQSYSYEDFVEGLRPVTDGGANEEGGAHGAGFRLEAKRGIFREICAVAEEARKNTGRRGGFDLAERRFFKMSLGRAGLEDHIFEAAIAGGYVVLGYGGEVDWSNARFAEWSAMMERWKQEKPDATGFDPNVVQMWAFRNMAEGDIIVVSEGNSHFRAIGEVTGPYRFDPTDVRDYNHKRPVRWLLTPEEPLPVETIYGKNFMMQSCYQLKDALLKKEALARILPGSETRGDGLPDQFVLIIDEINRANISKVFGELITLIEPDKRLGAGTEALAVQLPYSGDTFGVPANLHIVGTMNTADRSIALLDTALRRRFVFREIAPDPSLLPEDVGGVPLRRVLEVINDRIEYLVDREHRIGHAFFMGGGCEDRPTIDTVMRDKVIPLLQEYFFEDWGRVAAVLGGPAGKGAGFLDSRKLKDPTGQDGEERESWSVRSAFAPDAYERLVGKPATPPEAAPVDEAVE